MKERRYDSTVARIAGNVAPAILAGHLASIGQHDAIPYRTVALEAVELARLIVAEVERTGVPEGEPR